MSWVALAVVILVFVVGLKLVAGVLRLIFGAVGLIIILGIVLYSCNSDGTRTTVVTSTPSTAISAQR